MPKVMLLISKMHYESTHTYVKCALSQRDGMENARIREQIFSHPSELEDALRAAGVSDEDARAPHHVVNNGLSTFIPVSVGVARKLGVLD
jgi:hypothetical protein